MKHIGITSVFLLALAVGAFLIILQSNSGACLRDGAFPNSIAQATVKIGKWVHQTAKDDWSAIGVSKKDLLREISVIEVVGPAMTFEHPSTRYITFRLSNCPAITKPITVGVHCGDTPNVGWIAKSCLGRED